MGAGTRSGRVATVVGALLGVALVASSCSSSSSAPPITAPHGLPAFYVVPAGVGTKAPGTLLRYEKTTVSGISATAYRVMYVSTGISGKNVAVTGMVLVPPTAAPASGREIDFIPDTEWDISEKKHGQKMLLMQRDLGVALSRVSSLREMVDIVLDAVIRIDGIDCGGFYLIEKETRIYRLVSNRGLSPKGADAIAVGMPDAPQIKACEIGKPCPYHPKRQPGCCRTAE